MNDDDWEAFKKQVDFGNKKIKKCQILVEKNEPSQKAEDFKEKRASSKEYQDKHVVLRKQRKIIAEIILDLLCGNTLEQAIFDHYPDGRDSMPANAFESLMNFPDQMVVGRHFSSACYMEHSIPATLYLALKYRKNPEQGLISNTMCGGDNAGRGAVLGALLGSTGGLSCWPEKWVKGLLHPPEMVLLNMLS